jgi:polyphosphate:AMP phosphotransferase
MGAQQRTCRSFKMFEAAELGRVMSKEDFDSLIPELRARLLKAQFALRSTKTPVIVIISGADGAGKGDTVNRLHEWLDPRGLETNVYGAPSEDERERPPFWRFWMTLPARGRIGIFFGSWYTEPILQRAYGATKNAALDRSMQRIAAFEKMLADDGALILKFWFHLKKDEQKARLRKLEKNRKTRWRVSATDWKHFKLYDRFVKHSERSIRATDVVHAPWILVDAADDHYRDYTVAETICRAMEERLSAAVPPPLLLTTREAEAPSDRTILDSVDLTQTLSEAEYSRLLTKFQARLNALVLKAAQKKRSNVIVFEGWDAGGKGGAIRRVTSAIDARNYRVIPVAAPSDEERAHHYLWRFWRHIPRAGRATVYDRSWYGRVLVERVEGFAREDEWLRAFAEINDFEEQLSDAGAIVTKYWLHVSKDEQLRRFQERQEIEYKKHKITDEDWRNRDRWDAYQLAVNEMVARTSTRHAPWILIGANDKHFARVEILRRLCDRIEDEI